MRCEKILFEELQPAEFVERINAFPVAYLPLGTLEWHGLHLPLGADGIQSQGVFKEMAAAIGGIVLPMLFLGPDDQNKPDDQDKQDGVAYYGMDHHSFDTGLPQQLEGSAYYIESEQFDQLLDAIMRNLVRAGFKVVIGHGHGPSTSAFARRKQVFQDKFDLLTFNLWELGYHGADGIQTDHAAVNETSLVMALRPELVSLEELSSEGSPVGVWGEDPRKGASAIRGRILIDQNVKLASEKIQAIVAGLSRQTRVMEYHNVKSLLSE